MKRRIHLTSKLKPCRIKCLRYKVQRKYQIWRKTSEEGGSQPISRVLSRTVIPLGAESPRRSSDLPEGSASHAIAFYAVLLRMGFALPRMLPCARCALTAPFHHCRARIVQIRKGDPQQRGRAIPLTPMRDCAALRRCSPIRALGCMFSVALSVASRRPAVNRHPALWSPDFPLRCYSHAATV